MNKVIYTLVGIPASGKSTYVKDLMLEKYHNPFNLAKHQDKICVLNADTIRQQLYGDPTIQGDGAQVFGVLRRKLLDALRDDITELIIIDNTSLTYKIRKRYFAMAKTTVTPNCGHTFTYNLVFFPPNLERSLKWNKQRDRFVPEDVIERMSKAYTGPTEKERDTEEINIIEVNYEGIS